MSMASLMSRTVYVLRAARSDDGYGNVLFDWSRASRTQVRAAVSSAGSTSFAHQREQNNAGRDEQRIDIIAVLPAGTDITGLDRLEIDGASFDVVGPPYRNYSPRGEHHVTARLRRVEG